MTLHGGRVDWSPARLVLVVDSGTCCQQSLNCLSMSLQGSYPQRNITTLGGGLVDISTSLVSLLSSYIQRNTASLLS
jgi:hypothetical protein